MKLIKFASAALAATMAFSAAPIFAADNSSTAGDVSSTPEEIIYPVGVVGTDPNKKDGKEFFVYGQLVDEDMKAILKDEKKVDKILKDAGYKAPKDAKVVLIGAGEYNAYYTDGSGKADIKEAIKTTFFASGLGLDNDDTVYLLQQLENGEWKVMEAKVDAGVIQVTLDGLSTVAFYKVEKDGKVVELTKEEAAKEQAAYKATNKVVKKSPNTGI